MATLAQKIESFEKAGFSQSEITAWKKNKVKSLSQAGFTTQEIAKDLGYKEVNLTPIRNFWNNIINIGRDEHQKAYSEIEQLNSQKDISTFF